MTRIAMVAALALGALLVTSVRAADVAPGERQFSADPEVLPAYSTSAAPVSGEVLGTRTTPFEVRDPQIPDVIFSRGTFTARVVREPGQGGLTFDYLLDETAASGTTDLGPVEVAGFGTFSTDVRSRVLAEEERHLGIVRSADGDRLRFEYASEGLDEYIIVRTNAPDFAADGLMLAGYAMPGGDGFGTIPLPAFRPVPEPGAGAVAVPAALALLGRRRRRGT